jgi:hypothetical protein
MKFRSVLSPLTFTVAVTVTGILAMPVAASEELRMS